MGKLIITYSNLAGYKKPIIESLKCKSEARAEEIVKGRRNVKTWKYYENFAVIQRPQKKKKEKEKMSLQQMEEIIKTL